MGSRFGSTRKKFAQFAQFTQIKITSFPSLTKETFAAQVKIVSFTIVRYNNMNSTESRLDCLSIGVLCGGGLRAGMLFHIVYFCQDGQCVSMWVRLTIYLYKYILLYTNYNKNIIIFCLLFIRLLLTFLITCMVDSPLRGQVL